MDSVNAMDGIGTDPSSTSVRLWYDDGTFRARDAYHILGNKRTTIALRSGNWHSMQSWEESGCRQMEDESFLPRNNKSRVAAIQ